MSEENPHTRAIDEKDENYCADCGERADFSKPCPVVKPEIEETKPKGIIERIKEAW